MHDPALHRKGLLITFAGVMMLTVDTPLLRMIDGNQWAVLFWRNLMIFGVLMAWWAIRLRHLPGLESFINGKTGILVALGYSLSNICFIVGIHNTTVANVLFIVALTPFVAAVLSAIMLKEFPDRPTWLAIFACLGGVAIIVGDGLAQGNFWGDFISFGAALGLAFAFVLTRKSGKNMTTAPGLGALIGAVVTLPFVPDFSFTGTQWFYLSLNGFIVLPISFALLALGPNYITAAEVAMLMLLETMIGPILVWFAVGEVPTTQSLIGGLVVLATLIAHSAWKLRARPG